HIPYTPLAQGLPIIRYQASLGAHPVEVTIHYNSRDRVDKIELIAREGYQVTDERACDALYAQIAREYHALYGAPSPIAAPYRAQCKQQLRYDFPNSSFIYVHYQYRPNLSPACYIQMF